MRSSEEALWGASIRGLKREGRGNRCTMYLNFGSNVAGR
jgi:hypothetical protein